jgi:hypothetical protein
LAWLFAAALGAAVSGCWPFAESRPKDGDVPMSGPEARRVLARARKRLYGWSAAEHQQVVQLADSVIARCETRGYVWQAFLVKADAYQAADKHAEAAAAARAGVETLLVGQTGRLSSPARTYLKMLLVAYVENARARDAVDALSFLGMWRQELRDRYAALQPPHPAEAKAIDTVFASLETVLREQKTGRAIETGVPRAVRDYLAAFSRGDRDAVLRLLVDEGDLEEKVRTDGLGALTSKSAARLYLSGPVTVETANRQATAACAVLAVSAAGYAWEAPKVTFTLVRKKEGPWRIRAIRGHP